MTLEYQLSALVSYAFYGMWPILLLWEILVPARKNALSLPSRWSGNFGLYLINMLLNRWMIVLLGGGILAFASDHGLGIMNRADLPYGVTIIAGVLLLDLSIYVFHILSHKIPLLWRLHRVHHTDPEMDFSTNFRHHPLETMASAVFSFLVALIAGFPPESLLVTQLLSHLIEPFSHSNIRLPKGMESFIRLLFVTPVMHVVHHSVDPRETDSNYGTIFSIWDRLFRTYVPTPALGEQNMQIGLETFRDMKSARLPGALVVPFI